MLGGIFSIARTALLAQQKAASTASHNIANASTEGYTRQRLSLSAMTPLRTPDGMVGRGVDSGLTERVRSTFLDASWRREAGGLGDSQTTSDLLGRVGGVFDDLGENGVGSALDEFLGSWSDLARDPTSVTARGQVRQSAGILAQRLQATSGRLDEIAAGARGELQDAVAQFNQLTREITDLNRQIVAAGPGGAPDLADRRDTAIDQLSKLAAVRVYPQADGSVNVVAGSNLVADGSTAQQLEVVPSGAGYAVRVTGTTQVVDMQGGSIAALARFTTTTLPGIKGQLDALASAVVTTVNAIHRTGQTPTGVGNLDFFDPAGTTAATIAVSSSVQASLANIVTGTTTNAGDGGLALQLGQLRTTKLAVTGNQTLAEAYTAILSGVSLQGRDADARATAQQALVDNVQQQRQSVAGVNADEELVNLTRAQQAYAAATKIVTTADEMLQSLINMV